MINEKSIKITGVANIPKELELTKNYHLIIENAEVRKSELVPNDDGTENLIYHLRVSELSRVQISDGKEVIKAKIKGSPSKRFRNCLRYLINDDFDLQYEILINNLIINAEEVLEKYGQRRTD